MGDHKVRVLLFVFIYFHINSKRWFINLGVVDKKSIRRRLEWIIESEPRVNPSRATLKRVNEYLLTPGVYLGSAEKRFGRKCGV